MKVTRNTPDQLIVENNPILMAIFITAGGLIFLTIGLFNITSDIIIGLAFIASGLFVGIVLNMIFVRRTQLVLDRSTNLAEIRRRSWFGFSKQKWALSELEKAIVQRSKRRRTNNSRNSAPGYRAVLVINEGMDPGEHPLTITYSTGNGAERTVQAINAWLGVLDSSDKSA